MAGAAARTRRPARSRSRAACRREAGRGAPPDSSTPNTLGAISPKTLTGLELDLDDAPARESELFLVDGNNLAYRAYFALPEELATTEGFPTNALLGFTNMLFKLLSDYKPKGVAVAWDTRPVHRAAVAESVDVVYKEGRRPMADLLREQFPYFRPIVEAFGYRNLEFEGWEADDVIATLATQADAAGVRTCVVSTDRDAFQLVSENICLMMTPRGVSDVNVYTPDRVEARYGIRPEQIPDFIGLKGDSSDNIPGIPGIGDKTAGQLIAQYGSVEAVIEHAAELSPARRKNVTEFADQARAAKELATMRRDLELDCDPAELVLAPPDRSQLREMFRRFEFRNLFNRIDELDAAVPAAERVIAGTSVMWEVVDSLPKLDGPVSVAVGGDRCAVAREGEPVLVAPLPDDLGLALRDCDVIAHDYKSLPRLTMLPAEDTMIAAYLIEPGRPAYELDDLANEYGVEALPEPAAEEETAALVRAAEVPRRLAPLLRARVRERGSEDLYDRIELPLTAVLAAMEDAGVKIDTYRMGEITARLADRVEELESKAFELAGEEFMIGSTQQLARILFEKLELTPGRKGKTGYSTDTRVLRTIRDEHPIVEVIEEWRELTKLLNTYLGPLPALIGEDGRLHTTFNQAVAATGRLSTSNPNLQAIPIRTELGREIRSAFVAEAGYRLISADYSQVELRILAHVSGEAKLREAFARGEDIHSATAAEVLGKEQATLTKDERNVAKMVNFGIIYGISAFGLSENLEIPRDEAQTYIDTYLARFPLVQDFIQRTIEQASRDGYVTTLLGRRRPVPEIRAANRQTRSLGERLAVNSVMQGTAADIIKVAMVSIHRRLRDEGRSARLVLQVHDELLVETPDAEVSTVKELVREEMCRAYPLDPPLAVDVGAADDWHQAKS
ncbi:MAG TPA: DNA polymerase I [Gaiellaceae bacterium]|nr:DNA polymerase I [Gaiellaceae bacterium]